MTIPETYDYLVRARRDLWAALEAAPDEVLSRPLLAGPRFRCVKDLVCHVAAVEDSWLHEDILRDRMVYHDIPALEHAQDGPFYAEVALETLLEYWRAVEASTLGYLATLTEAELRRPVPMQDDPSVRFTVEGLLWHVTFHELRHSAQIAMLLRMQGIKPPALDLLFYLPPA
mgnify:CR=1 FL=1